jgi:uncharacterized RDD family membrane protein YckC
MTALEDIQLATPERVAVDLPVAGIGHRCLAYLVDITLIFFFWVTAYFLYSLLQADLLQFFTGLSAWGVTLLVLGVFATQWVYWTACEVALRGQTLGKRALHIRVVRADGSPVTFFESAVRNLCRAVDFLPGFYAVGVVCMLFTERHLRLGDLLAGTVLIREERVDLSRYTLDSGSADQSLARLSAQETELILEFLNRAPSMEPAARLRLGTALLHRLNQMLPQGVAPSAPNSSPEVEALLRRRLGGTP